MNDLSKYDCQMWFMLKFKVMGLKQKVILVDPRPSLILFCCFHPYSGWLAFASQEPVPVALVWRTALGLLELPLP